MLIYIYMGAKSKHQSKTVQQASVYSTTKVRGVQSSSAKVNQSLTLIRLTYRTIPTPNKITTPTNPNSRNGLLFPTLGTEPLVLEAVEAAAEPDFEAEPVAESPDADYQKGKQYNQLLRTTGNQKTNAPSS
jgi:hypothetical protein